MKQQKRILVIPELAVGHVNACAGTCLPLLRRGYRVGFFLDQTYRGKLAAQGFEEFIFESELAKEENPADDMAKFLVNYRILGEPDLLKQLKNMHEFFIQNGYQRTVAKEMHRELPKIFESFRPDLFILDCTLYHPLIRDSGKPWINHVSCVPLFNLTPCEDFPPGCSGLSINSDRSLWKPFKDLCSEFLHDKKLNDFYEELGYERYQDGNLFPDTQSLTVYAMPEEYEYPGLKEMKNYFNIEVFNKNENQDVLELKDFVPKEFLVDDLDGKWSGKWIYVSMGSMGSAELNLMNRLVKTLAKTPHKYIVSKGPRHQELKLERNQWGDRYLPQVQIIALMDLVITHGGNNTVTETFAQGKPMLVLPLFWDQHDNGTRLTETKYGRQLDPYHFKEEEMIKFIDELLSDEDLKQRLKVAAERINSTNRHEMFCDKVDEILSENTQKE